MTLPLRGIDDGAARHDHKGPLIAGLFLLSLTPRGGDVSARSAVICHQ
ncbi:MAG: hypothetical protein KA148_06680 [Ottowia sp.]|jgi:hypothetical protein|nr:hypothetical protein [Ottowia sp.]HRL35226.1 hypothetical protein [Ottowia beijingensis]